MNRKESFAPDEYYHLYNRGNDKRKIFLTQTDKDRFIKLLYLCNSFKPIVVRDLPKGNVFDFDRGESLVDVGAYCLMSNHFHFLIRAKKEGGVSQFIKKLATGYSMYFNLKYKRTGKLFEGTFRSVHVNRDEHLKYLLAYIHLNPLKLFDSNWTKFSPARLEKIISRLATYDYSSLLDYLNQSRCAKVILNRSVFPKYFSTSRDFKNHIEDCLALYAESQTQETQTQR